MIKTLPNQFIEALYTEDILVEMEPAVEQLLLDVEVAPSTDVMAYLFKQIDAIDENAFTFN